MSAAGGIRAVMMAAGIGKRLGGGDFADPKVLLKFGGKSLLQRHIESLRAVGVGELVLGVGYRAERIAAEVAAIGAKDFVRFVFNPDFLEGSVLTFWNLREQLGGPSGSVTLLMDADVLYHPELLRRLVASRFANCFLMDRDLEPGDEPVKLCLAEGVLVDLHKAPTARFDACGEWVGFAKLSAAMARRAIDAAGQMIAAGRRDAYYEEALRALVQSEPAGSFGVEDITGLPWIEIDFAGDVERAAGEILPRLGQGRGQP